MAGGLKHLRGWPLTSAFLVVAVCAIALEGTGCGSSSKSSSSTVSSKARSRTGSTAASRPTTKAQYEQKLGPLLNYVVDPALHVALSNAGGALPQKLTAAITAVRLAHDQMAALTPPVEVADLHKNTIAVLASMISHMTRLRDAATNSDKSAMRSSALALISDARHMETIGSQFTARGY